jgi:hypothetical protein
MRKRGGATGAAQRRRRNGGGTTGAAQRGRRRALLGVRASKTRVMGVFSYNAASQSKRFGFSICTGVSLVVHSYNPGIFALARIKTIKDWRNPARIRITRNNLIRKRRSLQSLGRTTEAVQATEVYAAQIHLEFNQDFQTDRLPSPETIESIILSYYINP